jgi:hypothetical protein
MILIPTPNYINKHRHYSSFLIQPLRPLRKKSKCLLSSLFLNWLWQHLHGLSIYFSNGKHTIDDPKAALNDILVSSLWITLHRSAQLRNIPLRLIYGVRPQSLQLYLRGIDYLLIDLGNGHLFLERFVHFRHICLHNHVVIFVIIQLLLFHQFKTLRLLESRLVTAKKVDTVPV